MIEYLCPSCLQIVELRVHFEDQRDGFDFQTFWCYSIAETVGQKNPDEIYALFFVGKVCGVSYISSGSMLLVFSG